MKKKITKILSFLVCFCLILEQCSFAQLAAELNMGKYFSSLSGALTQERMRPVHLRYISYDNLNDDFRLLLDKGNAKNLSAPYLEEATQTLLKYFFVGLSLPNEAFWVNLRPDSPDNIIEDNLAQTDVGRIMLDADVQLKKDTAGFTSPHTPEGKEYWQRLYKRAEELFGTENVSIPTMIRPWIVPDEVIIREAVDNAYIYKATLKVMLEQDYLKGSMVYGFEDQRLKSLNEYASELMRELIIPKITRDVNTAQRYAPLRQVYYSLILAQWFKKKFFGSPGMYTSMINRKNLAGFTSQQPWSKSTYFQAYQSSFKEGEYNLKTPIYTAMGQSIRTYMSGGLSFQGMIDPSQNPGVEIVPAGNRNIPGAVGYSGALSNVLSQMVVNKRGVVKEEPITPSSSASPVTSGSSSIQAPAEDGQLSVEQMFARLTEKLGARITVDRLMNEIRSFSSGVQYSGLEEAGISPSGLPGLADSQALSYIANKLDELGIADARSAAELAIRYYEMGGYAEFDSLVELGPDQTLTMRTGDRIDANPTSAKNKNLAAPRMVVASFNNGRVDGADITFGYFSNLFYEFFNRALPGSVFTKDQIGVFFGLSQNRALIPEVEKFLKEKGFILVEDANVFFAVRPLYVIVRNKTEYQATKELLDVAFNDGKNQRTMNMLKQVSEKVASSDKNSVYNIINIEEVKDFSVFSVSGETIDVQVSSIGPQGEFELTGRSPSGWQETYRVMPGLSDSIEGDYVYRTQELTPGQTERMLSGEDARLQVTGLGTGDATTIDKDYTNLMTTMGSERVLTDFSVESIYKLKRLGLLNPKNIQTMILTHNHADHNAGFIQLILELYNQAVQEAGPVATQEEITRLAQARINQYTMVMAPAVKEGLVRIIGAQLLGREGELDYPLARAGYWRAQAAKLLENIPDLMPLSVNGQAKEYKFIDEKKGLTIHFHETDHFIATYGYVLHREGYGSAAYVGDTQNINDFNWAVETLEKYDPEGTNSILISEQGNVGHLTLPMIFKAVSFSEYASKLTIRLVHTSLRDVPEEVEGISLGNIEVLAQGDTVAAKGSEDSASSALEEDKTAAYWGLIGEASAVTKDAIEKFSLRPNEEVYVESGGSVFRLSVADNHAVLMPYLKKVGRTQYADVGGAKENLMIFKVGEERCVVGSVKDALAEGGKAGDVLYSNHKFTRAGNEGGLSGKAFALKVSKEGVKYYFTVEHFSASYTQTNIFGAEKALSSAGQVAFNAYSKEGEIIEFRAYPRGRHYLTRLGDGQYRSAKDITSAIEEISGELKSHKITIDQAWALGLLFGYLRHKNSSKLVGGKLKTTLFQQDAGELTRYLASMKTAGLDIENLPFDQLLALVNMVFEKYKDQLEVLLERHSPIVEEGKKAQKTIALATGIRNKFSELSSFEEYRARFLIAQEAALLERQRGKELKSLFLKMKKAVGVKDGTKEELTLARAYAMWVYDQTVFEQAQELPIMFQKLENQNIEKNQELANWLIGSQEEFKTLEDRRQEIILTLLEDLADLALASNVWDYRGHGQYTFAQIGSGQAVQLLNPVLQVMGDRLGYASGPDIRQSATAAEQEINIKLPSKEKITLTLAPGKTCEISGYTISVSSEGKYSVEGAPLSLELGKPVMLTRTGYPDCQITINTIKGMPDKIISLTIENMSGQSDVNIGFALQKHLNMAQENELDGLRKRGIVWYNPDGTWGVNAKWVPENVGSQAAAVSSFPELDKYLAYVLGRDIARRHFLSAQEEGRFSVLEQEKYIVLGYSASGAKTYKLGKKAMEKKRQLEDSDQTDEKTGNRSRIYQRALQLKDYQSRQASSALENIKKTLLGILGKKANEEKPTALSAGRAFSIEEETEFQRYLEQIITPWPVANPEVFLVASTSESKMYRFRMNAEGKRKALEAARRISGAASPLTQELSEQTRFAPGKFMDDITMQRRLRPGNDAVINQQRYRIERAFSDHKNIRQAINARGDKVWIRSVANAWEYEALSKVAEYQPQGVIIGELGQDSEGYNYFISPHLPGQTLGEAMARKEPLVDLVEQLAKVSEITHSLHEMGIVYADIHPGNIYITDKQEVLLLPDFGRSSYNQKGKADNQHRRTDTSAIGEIIRNYLDNTGRSNEASLRGLINIAREAADRKIDSAQALGRALSGWARQTVSMEDSAASPLVGGIDFRAVPITIQPIRTLSGSYTPYSGLALDINLDQEWKQIENMLKSGIIPSAQRVKDYMLVCCQNNLGEKQIEKLLSCLASVFRLEEERVVESEAAYKELLVLAESDKLEEEFIESLANIEVGEVEPKANNL